VPFTTAAGDAKTASANATAAQKTAAGNFDPQAIAFGSYMLYKTGKMPALGMGGGAARMAILSGAAHLGEEEASTGQPIQISPFDKAIANGQDWTAANRAVTSFGAGPEGDRVRALNNVVGHLQLFEGIMTQLGNGTFQPGNAVGVAWQKMMGKPAPTNAVAAGDIIGPELTKILTNTGAGSEDERTGFNKDAGSISNSPGQTTGAIGTVKGMVGRQATDFALQYHAATGRNDFAAKYLAPDVAQYLEIDAPPHPTAAPSTTPLPGAAAPGAPPVTTAAPGMGNVPAAALPTGTAGANNPNVPAAQLPTGLPADNPGGALPAHPAGAMPPPGSMPAGVPIAPAQPIGVTHTGVPLALTNEQGWPLNHDAQGNHAYIGPNNEVHEVQ
jgi:hypothetical protein